MKATFKETKLFEATRADYFTDEEYGDFQQELMKNPEAGKVIQGTGGLRKVRVADPQRGKGKRGGLRVIYYFLDSASQFWMFAVYDKDEADDLSADERKTLKKLLAAELAKRSKP